MAEILNTFWNANSSSGTALETEHGLVMLLLLYGLLTYRGERLTKWVPVVILAGILLSIFTPIHQISLFWPVITSLIVPPYLWQAAVAVTISGPLKRPWILAIWAITTALIIVSLRVFSNLPLSNALLLGILTVTLLWYFRELNIERSYLSTIGLITLVVLLVEADLALVSLQPMLGTLASGVAVGIFSGFIGIYVFRKIPKLKWKYLFFFAWSYIAYLIGFILNTSAIASTLAAALVVSTYGFSIGLWLRPKDIPSPANTPVFFYLSAVVWITLGWQAHTVVVPANLIGILPVLAVVTIIIFVIRRLAPLSSNERWSRILRKETGVVLLLIGSIIFWPRQAFLTTVTVEIALVAALTLIIIMRAAIKPFFDIIGVQLSWPSDNK